MVAIGFDSPVRNRSARNEELFKIDFLPWAGKAHCMDGGAFRAAFDPNGPDGRNSFGGPSYHSAFTVQPVETPAPLAPWRRVMPGKGAAVAPPPGRREGQV